MERRPLVSVLVISHDYGRFLGAAIESALAQTYPRCEVVVVDDGSTDDSLEVAHRFGDRVRVLTHPNMGVERTCNRAVREARGEYFLFLSADDLLDRTYVDVLLTALDRSPDASYAYARARLFGAQSGLTVCFPYSAYILALRTNYINASALTRRDDFLALGGYAEELQGNTLEDWDFWLRMLEHGKRGTYVPSPLLRWRRHGAGSRNVRQPERLRAALGVIRGRHRPLIESLRGPGPTFDYLFDLGVAAADVTVGVSRSAATVRLVERRSWQRFLRHREQRMQRLEDQVGKAL